MKKSIKIKSLELFKEFAQKNNYGVFNDAFLSIRYKIRTPKPSEKLSDFYMQDLIEAGADKISNLKPFFQYIKYCLDSNNSDVALAQIIKKNYRHTSYEYDSYVSDVIGLLEPYKKTLFEYVCRPAFLEHSWNKLGTVFETIDDQERRIAIFEAMVNTKIFQNLDTQKSVYQLFTTHIKSKNDLNKYFTKIKKINEEENILDSIEDYSCIVVSYDCEKIANANLNGELKSSEIVGSINRLAQEIKAIKELGIKSVLTEVDSKIIQKMNIVCDKSSVDLNKRIFSELFNVVSRFKTRKEITGFSEDLIFFVKEKTAEVLSEKLSAGLTENKKTNKVKI